MRRSNGLVLLLAIALGGCGSTPSEPPTDGVPPAVPAPSAVPTSKTGDPGTTPIPTLPDDLQAVIQDLPPLPEPSLKDPFAIGEALYDPSRMDQAVVSLLDLMGVGIYQLDGTPIRAGDEREKSDLRLSEPEVRGLIAEGIADLGDDPEGELPYTFRDLHAGLAPFMPGVSADDLAATYADAYELDPDALVPQVFLGQPIEPETPLTRVQLWLLFVDGFVEPSIPATASLGAGRPSVPVSTRWGTASRARALVTTPPPGMSVTAFILLIERLLTAGYGLGLVAAALPGGVHEGHERTGSPVQLLGQIGELDGPVQGLLQGLPFRFEARPAIPITFDAPDRATWQAHGTLAVGFGNAQSTDGVARDTFTPKEEVADGQGELVSDFAWFHARASKADIVASMFDVPLTGSQLARLFPGAMQSPDAPILIQWHTRDGLNLSLSNAYDVKLGLRDVVVIGDASADGLDQAVGFLPRRDDGIYRGTMTAFGYVNAHCSFLGSTINENVQALQLLDVFAEVIPGSGPDPALDVVTSGSFGPQDLHLTFYPAGPPKLSDGRCIKPIFSSGGGPLGRRNLTYKWFNDSRWTDPSLGYTIHLPASGELGYQDVRLSAGSLNGPGGVSGVDSTWTIWVKIVEP